MNYAHQIGETYMPIRTPAHKQTDPAKAPGVATNKIQTLGQYIQAKYPEESPLTFDEWVDSAYVELNGKTFSRRTWWTDTELAAAREAWNAKKA